jgi:hypothetical protein
MNAPAFTNKQEYLAWVTEWKAEYKKLSQAIRDLKWTDKERQRAITKAVRDGIPCYKAEVKDYLTGKALERYQRIMAEHRNTWRGALSAEATTMLEWRKQSKVEAQRQYLESKRLSPA